MSYARMGWDGSDVYVYHHANGWIECCGCSITEPDVEYEVLGFFRAYTARHMLEHLDLHIQRGDHVPDRCIERIRSDYPDLDYEIEVYVTPPEVLKRVREKMRNAMMNSSKEEETK